MKLTRDQWFSAGKWIGICVTAMAVGWLAPAQGVSTTTVQGTVYLANGQPGSGTLLLSWPAFTTSTSQSVAAGHTTVSIGLDGSVSVNLAPNLGSSPAGLYYTAVYHMSDGTTSTEYWVVPAATQASIGSVRAQVMPAAQAVQAVSKAYVDQAIASLAQGSFTPAGGSLTGPLYLNSDPTQALQAADKHYVDATFSEAVPLSGGSMAGALSAPAVTASVNKVLLVTAPPYNAKCDGVTDDQAAIQAAFNDAYSNGYSIEFPAGKCLTSTIVIKGQSFSGHGKYVTTIVGEPGQDVFQAPDPSANPVFLQGAHIHDLNILVNASVDASASAAGGNNTFPYRVSGTAGGLTPLEMAPAPGPLVFGGAIGGNCTGQIVADGSGAYDEFYLPCANFANINASTLTGAPISIYNASGMLVISTTIASMMDGTHLKLAAPAGSAQSNLSGTYLNPIAAPWYVGNCGMAFPLGDGQQNGGGSGMLNGWVFENLAIGQTGTTLRQANHVCAIFMQNNNYAMNYEHVDTSMLYGGIVEALPYQNVAYVTWTPDTTKYFDVNLSHHILPLVTYNGTHRVLEGVSIYGGAWDSPQGMGAWMLSASTGSATGVAAYAANASTTRFYFECGSFLSGEVERFSGQSSTLTGGSTTQCGNGVNLGAWMTPAYVNWNVSDGSVDAQIGDFLQINGDHNTFVHTDLALGAVTDNGFENKVETGINNSDPNLKRAFYANLNMAQEPVGKLNGDFLLNGNSAAPFVSGSDLLTTCRDYRNLTSMCVNDPNGTELVKSYIHAPASGGTVAGISTGFAISWNSLMAAGSRIPLTQLYVVTQGRCAGASSCSSTFFLRDRVTSATIGSCAYTFGPSWTIQGGSSSNPCVIDFSSVPQGDAVGWDTNAWTASGLTAVDISFVGFQPQNTDVVSEIMSSAQLAGMIQSGAAGAPVNITAANWRWMNNNYPGVVDPTSPVGYSTAIGTAWNLYAWNGGTNLKGGALYPAAPSTISYLVQAPTVLTNMLASAMAGTDGSMTVAVPTTNSYASGGCFQVEQEIMCYSGALAPGSTTIGISRGQYGTLPQAHASGATVRSVGTATFYVSCNGTNYATTNVLFGATWSYFSSPFAAQNCSGLNTSIQLGFPNGPAGQTYKIAAVQIAQSSGNPQATGSNQVPLSAGATNGQYNWTSTKALAGSGAAIPTGPAGSTAGNLATFANNSGQIQDAGVAVGSLASLSATNTQTFAAGISAPTVNSIVYANPNAPGTTTAGINEALDSFGAAPNCGTIILPFGSYNVSTTIGGSHINSREGCVFQGQGMQDQAGTGGTRLVWTGTAGGTVLNDLNCYYCRFEKFGINGGYAGVAFSIEAESGSALLSFSNTLDDVFAVASGPTGTTGIAFKLFSNTNVMLDHTTFRHVNAQGGTCFDLSGGNTTNIRFLGEGNCLASIIGWNANAGFMLDGWEYMSGSSNSPRTDIIVKAPGGGVTIKNLYSETFGQILNSTGLGAGVEGYPVDIEDSILNGQPISQTTMIDYELNAQLTIKNSIIQAEVGGSTIKFAPPGTSATGTIGGLDLSSTQLKGGITITSPGGGSNGYVLADNANGAWGFSFYPKDTIPKSFGYGKVFDNTPIDLVGNSPLCQMSTTIGTTATTYYCTRAYDYSGNMEYGWYVNTTPLGGWNWQEGANGTFSASTYAMGYQLKNMSGQVLLTYSLTGYAGSSTGKVQIQDSAVAGDLASFNADGGTQDSGIKPYLSGTSSSIGGSSLAAGACATGAVSITGAATTMTANVSPVANPGTGFVWQGYVSSSNTVTVEVCAIVAGTPTATTYNVRVTQ